MGDGTGHPLWNPHARWPKLVSETAAKILVGSRASQQQNLQEPQPQQQSKHFTTTLNA